MSHSSVSSVSLVIMRAGHSSQWWPPVLSLFLTLFIVQHNTKVQSVRLFLIYFTQMALFLFLFRGAIIHDAFAFRFSRSLMASFPSYCCLCPVPSPAGFCLYCFSSVVPHTAGRTLLTVQHCAIERAVNLLIFLPAMSAITLLINKGKYVVFSLFFFFWFGIVPVILLSLCSQVTLAEATSSLCFLGFFFFLPTFCFCLYINSESMQMHRQSWTNAAESVYISDLRPNPPSW